MEFELPYNEKLCDLDYTDDLLKKMVGGDSERDTRRIETKNGRPFYLPGEPRDKG